MTSDPTTTASADGPASPPPLFGYRPALDGVRAIAVALVIVFHLGTGLHFRQFGGWLGVDVFFVLSGYLITSLLLTERSRHGHIATRRFYARRFLRLAPLSIAVMAFVWAAAHIAPVRSGLHLTNFGALSILLYFSNWTIIHRPRDLGTIPQYWSLSIEEQFYLVWPAVLILVFRLARRRGPQVATVLLSTLVLLQWYYRRHLWRASFDRGGRPNTIAAEFTASTFQRPDALLLGCLLAFVLFYRNPNERWRRFIGCWAAAGVVVAVAILSKADITAQSLTIHNFVPQWGLSLFNVSVVGIIAWLVVAPASVAARALSVQPLVWLGRRAYGIYLFHPIVLGLLVAHTSLGKVALGLLTVAATLGLAACSFRWFESPFLRRKVRFSSS